MTLEWGVVFRHWPIMLQGLWYTILLTVGSSVLGLIGGSLFALGRLSKRRWLSRLSGAILETVRGVPLLVLLIWFYYAFPIFAGVNTSALTAALIALSVYGGSYYGEIVRGGIVSIDEGQTQAALSLGMTYGERMRRIIFPQALRRMVPPLMNQTIIQLKNTSLAAVVTVPELLYQAQIVSSRTYRPFELYTSIAVVYLLLVLPLVGLSRRLEVKTRTA